MDLILGLFKKKSVLLKGGSLLVCELCDLVQLINIFLRGRRFLYTVLSADEGELLCRSNIPPLPGQCAWKSIANMRPRDSGASSARLMAMALEVYPDPLAKLGRWNCKATLSAGS